MTLPLRPDYPPMEALSVSKMPTGPRWQYEPKWDGFRCLVFKDGTAVELRSKAGRPLGRYFPELVEAVAALEAVQYVLDGEIVVPVDGSLSFDDLLLRIHPAQSRITRLAAEIPAQLIVFDLLVDADGGSLVDRPLSERRPRLEAFAGRFFTDHPTLRLSPVTHDLAVAQGWLRGAGGDLDGVVAKRIDLPYTGGERGGMQKVKRLRTADCVVGGFRYGSKSTKVAGSLLLGLYGGDGRLHHVGFTSSLKEEERRALTPRLEGLIAPPGFTGHAPGGPSRWATERSGDWHPLAPELVVEVQYDHFSGGRFRHGTKLLRWRPDKTHRQCTMDQVKRRSRGANGPG